MSPNAISSGFRRTLTPYFLTEHTGNVLYLYWIGTWFESLSDFRISWLMFIVIFVILSRQIPRWRL